MFAANDDVLQPPRYLTLTHGSMSTSIAVVSYDWRLAQAEHPDNGLKCHHVACCAEGHKMAFLGSSKN